MSRFSFISTTPEPERAVLVAVEWPDAHCSLDTSLDELERLAQTAGATSVARLSQRLVKPHPKSFIGSGKVDELVRLTHQLDADVIIFDDELSPSQQSYLEKAVGEPVKIIDRTALILDIFGLHAQTREGRLQVQLAQCEYLFPRLRGMWSHLAKEQTRGGIGGRFGQGESQLEVDRRLVRKKISSLKRELKEVEKRRFVQSKERVSSTMFRVALAGYTNAGKSSLLNALTGYNVLAEDKLFATLDPTTKALSLPGGRIITLTDTVGFIQKLPHSLVDAFKSTLREVQDADLILKIVDISDANAENQLRAVDTVLEEIGADGNPCLTVYNKCDLLEPDEIETLKRRFPEKVFFSARTSFGIEDLIGRISDQASLQDQIISARIPYKEGSLINLLHEQGTVISESYEEDATVIVAKVSGKLSNLFDCYKFSID